MILRLIILSSFLLFSFACKADDECTDQFICNEDGKCIDNHLFPIDDYDIIFGVTIIVSSIFSAISGIGGGALFVSLIIITLGFSTNDAVPLSQFTIFIVMGMKFIWDYFSKFSKRYGSNINYDIAALFSPTVFMGTKFGVILNRITPSWILLLLLVLLLKFTIFKTLKKGIQLYYKEKFQNSFLIDLKMENNSSLMNKTLQHTNLNSKYESNEDAENQKSYTIHKREDFEKKDLKRIDVKKFSFISIGVFFVVLLSIMKGRDEESSLIQAKPCSILWWGISLLIIPISGCLSVYISKLLANEYKEKEKCGFHSRKGDIQMNVENIRKILIIGIFVGTLSSLLGIGGGLLIGPLLLYLGLTPEVSSATGGFIALYTSIASALQYIIDGKIFWDYTILSSISGLIGSIIGMAFFLEYFRRKRLMSFIVFALCAALSVSLIMNIYLGTLEVIKQTKVDKLWKISKLC